MRCSTWSKRLAGASRLEADAGGMVSGQPAWKWRPDEHRRPVGLTSVSAHARTNACKMLVGCSARLS